MPMSLLGITSMCMPEMKSIGTAVNAWSTTQTDRRTDGQTDGQTQCKNIYIYIDMGESMWCALQFALTF